MIECQVDVIERVPNLVCDRSGEAADDRAFLRLVKLHLELARAGEFPCHFVEGRSERSHFIEAISRNLNVEVSAGDLPCRSRKLFDRTSKTPDEETRNQRGHEQNQERVKRRARRLSLQNIRQGVG